MRDAFTGVQGATRRVRATRRVVSKPDHRGRRQLIARKGEEMSLREAFRRELSEKDLEAVGPGGDVSFAVFKKAAKAKGPDREQLLRDAEANAADAERRAQQVREQERADSARGVETTWPADRGGGRWMLSDGTLVGPMEADEAAKAQAELEEGTEGGGDELPTTRDEILEWVGEDLERARTALEAEKARPEKDQRSTLVEPLEKLLDSA